MSGMGAAAKLAGFAAALVVTFGAAFGVGRAVDGSGSSGGTRSTGGSPISLSTTTAVTTTTAMHHGGHS